MVKNRAIVKSLSKITQPIIILDHFNHKHKLFFFSTRPSPGLLPVLGPLGSGTDPTHQPSPALRLLGYWWSWVKRQVNNEAFTITIVLTANTLGPLSSTSERRPGILQFGICNTYFRTLNKAFPERDSIHQLLGVPLQLNARDSALMIQATTAGLSKTIIYLWKIKPL